VFALFDGKLKTFDCFFHRMIGLNQQFADGE
jgi:hypothetical protein